MPSFLQFIRVTGFAVLGMILAVSHAVCADLEIPVEQGCSGRVRYSNTFKPQLRKIDATASEDSKFLAGTWKSGGESFQVYYHLGPSCDPSFSFENSRRESFNYPGEFLDLSASEPSLRQAFNVCWEITRKLSRSGSRILERDGVQFPVQRRGVLVRAAGLYLRRNQKSAAYQLQPGVSLLVQKYRPPTRTDFHHWLQVRIDSKRQGWIKLSSEGQDQQTEVDFMRCRGD